MGNISENFMVEAVLFVILGLVLVVRPEGSLGFICKLFGVILLGMGAFRIITYARGREKRKTAPFVIGIIQLAFGAGMLARTRFFIGIVPYVAGIVILCVAVISLIRSLRTSRKGKSSRAATVFSIAAIILAGVVIANPVQISSMITRIIGIGLIFVGVSMPFSPPRIRETDGGHRSV